MSETRTVKVLKGIRVVHVHLSHIGSESHSRVDYVKHGTNVRQSIIFSRSALCGYPLSRPHAKLDLKYEEVVKQGGMWSKSSTFNHFISLTPRVLNVYAPNLKGVMTFGYHRYYAECACGKKHDVTHGEDDTRGLTIMCGKCKQEIEVKYFKSGQLAMLKGIENFTILEPTYPKSVTDRIPKGAEIVSVEYKRYSPDLYEISSIVCDRACTGINNICDGTGWELNFPSQEKEQDMKLKFGKKPVVEEEQYLDVGVDTSDDWCTDITFNGTATLRILKDGTVQVWSGEADNEGDVKVLRVSDDLKGLKIL